MSTIKTTLNDNIFHNSKVLITGNTGFKGSWLSLWLNNLGAQVIGISNGIPTSPSHFEDAKLKELVNNIDLDIREFNKLKETILDIKPNYIFHLAAQPLVKKSYYHCLDTWSTNANGTINILETLRSLKSNCIVIFITSDKVYDNQEWSWGYRENDRIGGPDPYSASKGAAELAISSYYRSFFKFSENIKIGIARAGNVIGGGDWAQDRIVPDCIRAWRDSEYVHLRSPFSTRPWQHVLEPLSGYLKFAIELKKNEKLNGEAFNFGPPSIQNKSVEDLVKGLSEFFDNAKYKIIDQNNYQHHESQLLKLNCDKALNLLKWKPTLSFSETISFTASWYIENENNQKNTRDYSLNQIKRFMQKYNSNF